MLSAVAPAPAVVVGSIVVLHDMSAADLNGKSGFVAIILPNDRLGVILFRFPPPASGKFDQPLSVSREKVAVQASSTALLLRPHRNKTHQMNPDAVVIEPFTFACPLGNELVEMESLKKQLGWKKPQHSSQTCYSKYFPYPDLYLYYDGG